jgi:hypothetical protein
MVKVGGTYNWYGDEPAGSGATKLISLVHILPLYLRS